MTRKKQSSRQLFASYRAEVGKRPRRADAKRHDPKQDTKPRASRARSFGQLIRSFFSLLRGHRRPIVFALATLTVATILKLAPPAATKIAIDYVLPGKPIPEVWADALRLPTDRVELLLLLGASVVSTSLIAAAVQLWGRWHATRTVNRVQVVLRKMAFQHAMQLPLHRVYDLKSGGATSVLREDAGGAAELIFSMLYNPWRAVVQFTGSLIILMFVDWRMMIGGVLLLPVVFVTHRTWIRRIRPLWRDVRKQRERIDATSTEAFGGIRIVRGFSRERTETGRYVRANDLLIRKQLFVWWWSRIIDITWTTLIPLASTGLLLYGGYRILQGTMTLGDLTMFLFYLVMLLGPLATLVTSAATFQNNLAGLDRILDLLDEPREMQPTENAISLTPADVHGQITFANVSFRYPGSERFVLKGVDLDIHAGETVALVGRSGAGKTTLCNLVARFYDPSEGRICLDGRDLRDIRVDAFRRLLGIVEQDVFLFDGSVSENIGYGCRGATQAEIVRAAVAANAHEFVDRLDDGYDTLIGERGVKLSGGQRQRLAIARALLAEPRILILDEATSNLDSESERLIQQSLGALTSGRTSLIIAHRLSTIGLADRIAVLDEGEVIAFGHHSELLATSEIYRRMVELQTMSMDVV